MTSTPHTASPHDWLAELVARHGPGLRAYLSRFAQSSADVEDWVQEALLKVCAAGLDREIDNPRAYLFSVARNVALGRLEHRRVRFSARFDLELAARTRSEAPPVHEAAQTDRDVRQLRAAIERLPARCREVFVLCKIHGFSQKETSQILGISTSTIEKHLSRGLKQCRAMLLGEAAQDAATPAPAGRLLRRVSR
ncbi:RNA polymerase sigma factor [Marinihelvus fidelis]|uniref:RNA polymerase sigma factor n=1 Tax=Marinihelvus fidelis TaxID=2613842 RepID=UPI00178211AE|nr:sigma-70 family RNA polymerase sigma factor [Marinihelvus fidelis]